MSEPILRIAAVFCGLGMGVWPAIQRCGCCCATSCEIADVVRAAECRERTPCNLFSVEIPAPVRVFEAVPAYAIKTYTDDFAKVDAVFTSVFHQSRPGATRLWEIVENIPPAGVPKHVLFCTMLD